MMFSLYAFSRNFWKMPCSWKIPLGEAGSWEGQEMGEETQVWQRGAEAQEVELLAQCVNPRLLSTPTGGQTHALQQP